MRKPTLQLQVGGKRKINLSGKQVRRQLVWDTRRTHAAHLNLTPSAPSTWEGKHGDASFVLLVSTGLCKAHAQMQSVTSSQEESD